MLYLESCAIAFAISATTFAILAIAFAISETTFATLAIALDNAYLQLRDFQEINYPKFIFYRFVGEQEIAPLQWDIFLTGSSKNAESAETKR
ncbi:hypothetical protein FM036_22785 [Nostoc sp. HG1]|nr:hypothetical protein [Nostoc sp. HG1]MCL6754973.1 hypothetical protein [Nostoc sp. CCCryo 231-06]